MHFKLLNPGRYFGAADFEAPDWKHGKEPTVTMQKIVLEQMEGEKPKGSTGPAPTETKGMITLAESPKGWLMNVTNAKCLAAMFGNETNAWVGKRVTLHVEQVMSFGEWVPGIRIHGSPDIAQDVAVLIKLRKKKEQTITLKKTGASAPANGKSNGTPRPPFVADGKVRIGPRKGTEIILLTHADLADAIAASKDAVAKAKPGASWLPDVLAHQAELEADQARRAKLEEQMASGAPPPGAEPTPAEGEPPF